MVRGVTDAWSLEPIALLRLGSVVHPVPPLTFGRFQRLLDADRREMIEGLIGEMKGAGGPSLATRVMNRALKFTILRAPWLTSFLWGIVDVFRIGRRRIPAKSAASLVHTVIPSVTEEEWRKHGSQQEFGRLFLAFANAHDWGFIADAIRFGEPIEDGEILPSAAQVTQGLLAVAKETGYTMEGLTAMRLDGFYRLTEALREQADERRASAAADRPPLSGIAFESEIPQKLVDLVRNARGEPADG